MQNGKGSKPRPIKDIKDYCERFDEINWKSQSEKIVNKEKTQVKANQK
jgi:hypothetical protein